MGEIEKITAQHLQTLLQFVAPGFIIVYFRSIFLNRITISIKDHTLLFILVSTIYAFAVFPLLDWLVTSFPVLSDGVGKWSLWLATTVFMPLAVGVFLGHATQSGWTQKLWLYMGLRPLNPYPTSWDWKFGQLYAPTYIIVTIDGGIQIAGFFGVDSFAASNREKRDIYIEEVWDLEGNVWSRRQNRIGIWIPERVIRHIELVPPAG
jgi:hypothetical protein